jgi:hypothetical protein
VYLAKKTPLKMPPLFRLSQKEEKRFTELNALLVTTPILVKRELWVLRYGVLQKSF